jgi:hypothetical protein
MPSVDGETLRAWRRSRGWDVPRTAQAIRRAASEAGQPIAAHDAMIRMIYGWERGDHKLSERYELLYAAALDVTTELLRRGPIRLELAAQSGARRMASGPYAPEVIATIGAAVHNDHDADREPPAPTVVHAEISRAWELRQSAQYVHLGDVLTGLLYDTATWMGTAPGERQASEAATAAVHTHDMVSSLLKRLGAYEMAAIVADRAFRVARGTSSRLLIGAAQLRVANVYLSASCHTEAVAVAAAAADKLPPREASPRAELATFGALLLTAAVGSAGMGEAAQAWEFLGHAKAALRGDHEHADLYAVFGPVNLAVHGVQVATELGDGREALRRAERVDESRMPSVLLERRSTLLIDIARSHRLQQDHTAAAEALLQAERVAPLEVRYNATARSLLGELLTVTPASAGLREMASRLGVAA